MGTVDNEHGGVAQLVESEVSHLRGCGFKSRRLHTAERERGGQPLEPTTPIPRLVTCQ